MKDWKKIHFSEIIRQRKPKRRMRRKRMNPERLFHSIATVWLHQSG
jgi:hypothetical protein